MNDLKQLQFALEKQAHHIESVSTSHGNIPLSKEMKQQLGYALAIIIGNSIKHKKKALITYISSDIDDFNK